MSAADLFIWPTHAVVGEMLKHGKKLVLTSFAMGIATDRNSQLDLRAWLRLLCASHSERLQYMHSFHYRDGHLCCEDVDLTRVAEEFGTPTYVYSAGTILDHYTTTRCRARAAGSPHLLCGKSELESRDPEVARAARAPDSTLFPVASCFVCSRRAAIRPSARSQA